MDKLPGPFDFLHIKGRTAGSSNELSFDVLDAARSGADAQSKRASKAPTGPKPSQGTYHGVAGTSTLSAVPEVERRKRARRRRSARTAVIAIVIVALLVGAGAFLGVRYYHEKVAFSGRFDQLIDRFVEVDQTLSQIDALMVDSLNSVEADARKEKLAEIPGLIDELGDASREAADMEQAAISDADRLALGAVQDGIAAREDMLAAADDAFTLSAVVNKQVTTGNEAWSKVLAADDIAREATAIANGAATEELTNEARAKTEEAIADLASAREGLTRLEKEADGLDLADEIAYIDERTEALEQAVATADALLANDRAAAQSANDAYNAADATAAELAAGLSRSIADKVRTLHDADAQRTQRAYDSARATAATADSAVRAYLS